MIDSSLGSFPTNRMRRNRRSDGVRRLVAENKVTPDDFIWPLFVVDGEGVCDPVESMPGVDRLSVDKVVDAAREAHDLGIPAIAIFPFTDPAKKTPDGAEALNPNNLVCSSVRAVKAAVPDMLTVCDVALDPYTTHGHDGLLEGDVILNDATLEVLTKQALVQAEAGCDTIAPSDMMDGRVAAIRAALDENGLDQTRILAYAAKYASVYFNPFRDAIGSVKALQGDKRTYQMNPANSDEALREVAKDISEGADMVMIKPGMPYLDIIRRVKDSFGMPTFAYQVSGEYSMIKSAGLHGWLDADAAMMEAMVCFKRAGADGILTYAARDMCIALNKA
ncbi:MAG: porphobilinogen synthase [Alphaproteobacteria bacterium]|jgi:porphobilinogen synthase